MPCTTMHVLLSSWQTAQRGAEWLSKGGVVEQRARRRGRHLLMSQIAQQPGGLTPSITVCHHHIPMRNDQANRPRQAAPPA